MAAVRGRGGAGQAGRSARRCARCWSLLARGAGRAGHRGAGPHRLARGAALRWSSCCSQTTASPSAIRCCGRWPPSSSATRPGRSRSARVRPACTRRAISERPPTGTARAARLRRLRAGAGGGVRWWCTCSSGSCCRSVLLRSADPEEARWTPAFFRRCRKRTQGPLLGLLGSEDLRVRRGALACGCLRPPGAGPCCSPACRIPRGDVRASRLPGAGGPARAPRHPRPAAAFCAPLRDPGAHGRRPRARARCPAGAWRCCARSWRRRLEPTGSWRRWRSWRPLAALPGRQGDRVSCAMPRRWSGGRPCGCCATAPAGPEDRLIEVLDDLDLSVRTEAVEALVRRGCRKAEAALVPAAGRRRSASLPRHPRAGPSAGDPRRRAADGDLHPPRPAHERIEIVAALNLIAAPGLLPFLKDRLLRARPRDPAGGLRRAGPAGHCRGRRRSAGAGRATPTGRCATTPPGAWGVWALPAPARAVLLLCRDVEPVVARTARVALAKLGKRDHAGVRATRG